MMFKQEGPVHLAQVYGIYRARLVEPGEPWYLAKSFVVAIYLLIQVINIFRKINRCKNYCLKHGYNVVFTAYTFEHEEAAQQDESMDFRHLIQRIEQERVDMVLFIDFDWIRRKPERVERLLKVAQDHHTTLIDMRQEQIISQPFEKPL